MLLLMGFVCIFYTLSVGSESDVNKTQSTKVAMEKWIETQRVISQEKRDLALSKETLNDRIAVVQREIESLQSKITDAESSIAEADKKRAEMVEENEKLKMASNSLVSVLNNLEGKLRHLIERLPDPIRDRIKPLSQRLPNDSEQAKQSVAERFQNIVGILNEVDKFNREISMTSEVRTLDDGTSVEVAAFYMGIGQAYYVSASGNVAGIGTFSETGWVWKSNNEAAESIAAAIAMLKNEKPASFVHLPITIQ
jgi:septal ring factor EnvC (AmiA/AmiB activator)